MHPLNNILSNCNDMAMSCCYIVDGYFLFTNLLPFICYTPAGLMLSLLVAFSWATLPLMSLFSYLFSNPSTSFTRISMFSVMTGKDKKFDITINIYYYCVYGYLHSMAYGRPFLEK